MPVENVRLRELVAIVNSNLDFYKSFVRFLNRRGYRDVRAFVNEPNDQRASTVFREYLATPEAEKLLDGLGRPYDPAKAKWYFLAWLFRDAPAQRLAPLLKASKGGSLLPRQAELLNEIRKYVAPLFPDAEAWAWPAVREVMLARLEGSRRALKGTHAEEMVRGVLRELFTANELPLTVGDAQVRLNDETYDVQVISGSRALLIPVKTRETMGGGHAKLFMRDIDKSIAVAREHGYSCIPIVVAESWAADLGSLGCDYWIHLKCNPNEPETLARELRRKLHELLSVFREFARG